MVIRPEFPDELKTRLIKRPLVLFGAGGLGLNIAEYCESNEISIACFADSKATGVLGNKQILSPQDLMTEYPEANIVVSSNIFFDEIKQKLEEIGFHENQILSYKLFLKPDISWDDLEENAKWERMRARVQQMSKWIEQSDRSIVDYGAGEMLLKSLLPSEVKYFPIDYIKRSDETVVCDLNDGMFPDTQTDVAFLSGILEFLFTADALLDHVCETTQRKILLSYMTLEKFPGIDDRRASAYVNDYTEKELIQLLEGNGFCLKSKEVDPAHNINTLFYFEKSST